MALLWGVYLQGYAQQYSAGNHYQWPEDSLVARKLHRWQDVKFGLLMHWGPYSEWGVVESWSLCPEDERWWERKGPYADDYYQYVAAYEKLQTTFNPTLFNPRKWAQAAKNAGMKYVVFTTKHHDGFCMFDTDQTDYKVTDPKTPFSFNARRNITKEIFNAFRTDSFMIGAYFSKPDWHSNDYWWKRFPPKSRNPSYDPARYPEKWERFKQFTYRQLEELMTDYGTVDILWLDGGWVRPKHTINAAIDWQQAIPYDQDIDMPAIARMSRSNQPGLLMVDRTVGGAYENYVTPEQTVPDHYLPYPWESCITMGTAWSYKPEEHFKSTNAIIHLLTDVVSRNGNLLLNIAPSPDGDWQEEAYTRLKEIGNWLRVNGEAIYDTKGDSLIGGQGPIVFTHKPGACYAIYRSAEGAGMPEKIALQHLPWQKIRSVTLLGSKASLKWEQKGDSVLLTVPARLRKQLPCKEAWAFRINY